MKRKLLLLTAALLCSVGTWAADLPTSGSGQFYLKNVGTGTFLKGDCYWGTKAVVWDDPYYITLTYISDGVYTLQSQQNNGTDLQYFTNVEDLYVDGTACNMTFTEVDAVNHYYTISNAVGNLYATSVTEDGATLYKVMAGNVSTDYAKWQILNKTELIAALSNATSSVPVDASFYIKDAGIDVKSVNESNWTISNVGLAGGGNAGHNGESYNTTSFSISQTLSDLPHGKYKVTCNGYYRWNSGTDNNNKAAISAHASGTEVLNAKFYAGDNQVSLMSIAGDADAITFCTAREWDDNTPNNQWQAAACFTKGYYLNTIDDVIVTSGSLEIGVKKDTKAGTDWAVFDNFKLYYYGNNVEYYSPATFNSNNSATKDTWYEFSVGSAGWYRIESSAAATLYYTQNGSDDADAIATSKAFTAGGYTFMNLSAGSFFFKSSETSTIKIEAISSSVLQNGDVVTEVFITNPSFEAGDLTAWTNTNTTFSTKSDSQLGNKVGTYYAYAASNRTQGINQDLSGMPIGYYVLHANAYAHDITRSSTELTHPGALLMGGQETPIRNDATDTYSVAYQVTEAGNVNVGIAGTGKKVDNVITSRFYVDNFTLTYYTTLPDVSITSLTSEPMAGDVRAALDAANTAYTGSKTVANYNDLQTAIVNARTSIAEYAAKKVANADWTGVITNPSFSTGTNAGWTLTGSSGNRQYGSYTAEAWNNNNVTCSQVIKSLPAGTYKLTAQVDNGRDNCNVSLYATCNGSTYSSAAPYRAISSYSGTSTDLTGDASLCLTTVYLKVEEGEDLTIGVKDESTGTGWMISDNFQLTYDPTLPASVTAVEGKMNGTVESTQTSAVSTYNSTNNIDNLVAAQAAIYAATKSKVVYNEITTIKSNYDTKAAALDATGQAAYAAGTSATKYTNGTYVTASEAETAYHDDYIAAVKAQDTDNADMTDLIVNPSFEYGYNLNPVTGWTVSVAQGGGTGVTARYKTDNGGGLGEGGGSVRFFNWTPSAGKVTVGQTITDLEPGTYKLSAYVLSYADNVVTLKAGETSNSVTLTDGNATLIDVTFTQASAGSLAIEFSQTGTWFELDNFHLTLLASYYANAADYAALNAAISTATTTYYNRLGFETGDYAPYENIDALTKLDAANAIDQSAANTKTSVQTATSDLTGATWNANAGSVNAIYNSNMAVADGNNPKGWSRQNNDWGKQVVPGVDEGADHDFSTTSNSTAWYYNNWTAEKSSYYGNTGHYTMPLKANTMYEFKVKYCSQGTGDGGGVVSSYKATIQNGDETAVLNEYQLGENKTQTFVEKKIYFMTTSAGDYVLTLTNIGNIFFTDVSITKVADQTLTLPSETPYAAGTYPAVTIDRDFSTTNWATLCVPFAFDASKFDVKELSGITVTGETDKHISMTLGDVTTPVAGKPYLVKAKEAGAKITGTNVALNSSATAGRTTTDEVSGYSVTYQGTYDGVTLTSSNSNAWVVKNNLLYNVNSDVNVGAYRAYFTVDGPALVKAMSFGFDGETGITKTTEKSEGTESLFDLSGRRVSKAQKGLYIMNGKKVMVK